MYARIRPAGESASCPSSPFCKTPMTPMPSKEAGTARFISTSGTRVKRPSLTARIHLPDSNAPRHAQTGLATAMHFSVCHTCHRASARALAGPVTEPAFDAKAANGSPITTDRTHAPTKRQAARCGKVSRGRCPARQRKGRPAWDRPVRRFSVVSQAAATSCFSLA